jgi:hypothetical protein
MVDLNLSEIPEKPPIFALIFHGFLIAGINICASCFVQLQEWLRESSRRRVAE